MSKVILHIGTHKTATTTVQDTFWKNAALLEKHGIIYPRQGKATGHHGLVFDWGSLPAVYRLPDGSRETFRQLARDHAHGDTILFLSSEEFSRGDPKGAVNFAEVRELLAPFDEIEVVCVLRPQWQFIQSVYLELSKKLMPPRPPVLVNAAIKTGMVAGLWADYTGLLDQLEQVFAPEEITFMTFNAALAAQGGIIGAMLGRMGRRLQAEDLASVNDGASNISPMSLASWSANILSEPKVAPPWLVQTTTRLLHEEYGEAVKPCLFTQDEFRAMKTHFDARNALLHSRRAAVQPEFFLPPADAEGLTLFRNEVAQPFWVRAARLLVAEKMG